MEIDSHQVPGGQKRGSAIEEELHSRNEAENADLNWNPHVWPDAIKFYNKSSMASLFFLVRGLPLRDELRWQFGS